ncbi:glycosyl transferase family 1 [Roseiarcus fermentans]|uniref:Glycosyl transferase family 1 n=1 Tax=Roseiarcus fermentans TaxID=1473586 RepID=A0A366FR49_9HYPH|nr:glycosyltransferase family 1 protein [Roseiarcus fermentans]RBP17163.1 glycosyl transferase family 1 [Roseiarcus fermentans]
MTSRPVLYDLTRLFSRVFNRTPNGIDRVDFAFADHFLGARGATGYGLLMTPIGPRVYSQAAAREVVDLVRRHWGEEVVPDQDRHLTHVSAALRDDSPERRFSKGRAGQFAESLRWMARHGVWLGQAPGRLAADGAVYLNVSQYLIDFDLCLRWLGANPAIDGVFFLHDLLPLQLPEYFRPTEYRRHEHRLRGVARRGRAAIVSSQSVRSALARHMAGLGRPDLPILVAPLAPDPTFSTVETAATADPEAPYFVMCGTIEPRKNHLLILQVWRDLVARLGDRAPKLVLVGERGWENEHIIDLLDRSVSLRRHVVEVSGLPTPSLKRLMLGARALLMPSFGEGYGLPIVEALAAGVPVIASDIPVFHEIGGGRMTMIDPTDGPGWLAAIRAYADDAGGARTQALARLNGYRGPAWASTLAAVESFLAGLPEERGRCGAPSEARKTEAAL